MIRYIILTQSKVTANALEACIKAFDVHAKKDEYERIVWENARDVSDFRRIAERMESLAKGDADIIPRNRVTVLVDSIRLEALNPIGENGWGVVVAMLILAFPEFRWVFGVCTGIEPLPKKWSLASMGWAPSDPLFDGDGLRDYVRQLAARENKDLAGFLPSRGKLAAALDDEVSYGYFHAYAAYRFGFRAHAVTSEQLAVELFGRTSQRKADRVENDKMRLSLEDLYLNYPDHSSGNLGSSNTPDENGKKDIHLSDLDHRNQALPGLGEKSKCFRVFITTGQRRRGNGDVWNTNREFRNNLRQEGRLGTMLYKPVAGIFSLWEESHLMRKLRPSPGKGRRGYAEGFIWPPICDENTDGNSHGHSAPGKLLEVASYLINRADTIYHESSSVEDAVQGAVLATDALELVGGRTPTTALEALALKHQLEVTAGCLFYGAQFNLLIKPRLQELRQDIRYIGKWFNRQLRPQSEMNAELGIVSELARIFREYTEFDEERICLNRVRDLCRELWVRKYPWQAVIYPLRWYIDFLMGSLTRLVCAIIGWAVVLWGIFYNIPIPKSPPADPIQNALVGTLDSFFQTQPSPDFSQGWGLAVSALAIIAGFIHLGIFISHLYTISSRR